MDPLPRSSMGRYAAILTAGGSILSFIALAFTSEGVQTRDTISTGLALVAAVVVWFLPWERMGRAGTIGFAVTSLVAMLLGGLGAVGSTDPVQVPVFMMALFVWNGLANGRLSCVALGIPATLVFFGPAWLGKQPEPSTIAMVITIPMAVLVGELSAWLAEKARTAVRAREAQSTRLSLLTAISHEMRTPLTSIGGFAQMLNRRSVQMTPAELQEYSATIADNAAKLESIIQRVVDVEALENNEGLDLSALGVMAEHYGGAPTEDRSLLGESGDDPSADEGYRRP